MDLKKGQCTKKRKNMVKEPREWVLKGFRDSCSRVRRHCIGKVRGNLKSEDQLTSQEKASSRTQVRKSSGGVPGGRESIRGGA